MGSFSWSCRQQGSNRDTYYDILSRLEGADVVGVMHVIHLLQDGRHAGEVVTLPKRGPPSLTRFHSKISLKKTAAQHVLCCLCGIVLGDFTLINAKIKAEVAVVKDLLRLQHHTGSYDEKGGPVHADDCAINPAKKPLHYQLNVPSGWTLQRQRPPQVQWKHGGTDMLYSAVAIKGPNSAKLQNPFFTPLFLVLALFAKVSA